MDLSRSIEVFNPDVVDKEVHIIGVGYIYGTLINMKHIM